MGKVWLVTVSGIVMGALLAGCSQAPLRLPGLNQPTDTLVATPVPSATETPTPTSSSTPTNAPTPLPTPTKPTYMIERMLFEDLNYNGLQDEGEMHVSWF